MKTSRQPRRGSFLATWRMFSGGATRAWASTLIVFACTVVAFWTTSSGKVIPFPLLALMVVFCLGFATWQFEGETSDRMAFMLLVPQPVDTPRLVLVPMCALGILTAIAVAVFARQPAAAPALLGVAWWTIAATRWLWHLRFWPLFVLPLLLAEPAAVYAAQRFAGGGAAAALSMVLGIAALAFQPRGYVGETLTRMLEGAGEGGEGASFKRPTRRPIAIAAGAGAGLLASSWRFLALGFGGSAVVFVTISVAFLALTGLTFPFVGRRVDVLLWPTLLVLARLPAFSYSGDMHEFLSPRPFRNGPRVVGGVVFPLLLALIVPVAALSFLNHGWFETGGLIGHIVRHRPPSDDDLRYMREILGAAFLPAKWPAGGLPEALWVQLRPFLLLDALRTALLMIAMVFGLSTLTKPGEKLGRRPVPRATMVAFLVIMALFVRVDFLEGCARWPVPRLWFLALVAATAVGHWSWKARRLNAPASDGATGTSG